MLTDTVSGMRKEANAALADLVPQIRGLDDLASVSLNPETKSVIAQNDDRLKRRRDLLKAVLSVLDDLDRQTKALSDDGYPDVPVVTVSAEVFADLKQQMDDFAAAFAEFAPAPVASQMNVSLGSPSDKP